MTSPSGSDARRPRPAADIPFLQREEIAARADEVRRKYHPSDALPVPVEPMIEQAGIDLAPIGNLRRDFAMEALASQDGSEIYYDLESADLFPARFRFSLAHEWGHLVLHAALPWWVGRRGESPQEWARFLLAMSEPCRLAAEFQANVFAEHLLMPTAHLIPRLRTLPESVRGHCIEARLQGAPERLIREYAWEELRRLLARQFDVSGEAMGFRLRNEGCTPESLVP